MGNRKYIDFDLIKRVPNKYNIKPEDIKKLNVLDWDKLKKNTWYNEAMKDTGEWYCHLEGSNGGGFYDDDEDEFWIGFNKKNGEVDFILLLEKECVVIRLMIFIRQIALKISGI